MSKSHTIVYWLNVLNQSDFHSKSNACNRLDEQSQDRRSSFLSQVGDDSFTVENLLIKNVSTHTALTSCSPHLSEKYVFTIELYTTNTAYSNLTNVWKICWIHNFIYLEKFKVFFRNKNRCDPFLHTYGATNENTCKLVSNICSYKYHE